VAPVPRAQQSLTGDRGDSVAARVGLRLHLRPALGRDANKVRRAPDQAALARVGAIRAAAGAGRSGIRVLGLDVGIPGGRHANHVPVESVPPEALPAGIRPLDP
jgi:hypothetical protein